MTTRRLARPSALLVAAALVAVPARGDNASFRPGELWPDDRGVHVNAHGGGILDFEGRYYWFGEHKVEGEAGNSAQVGIHCYSSRDLYNWKDEGVVLPVVKDDPDHDLAVGSIVERPKVIHNRKTGKFVMWFHLERKGTGYASARSGVAVADRVTGPYAYRGSFRPNARAWPRGIRPEQKVKVEAAAKHRFSGGDLPDEPDRLNLVARDFEGGQMARDQTLFVDDDGTAYHVYASEENSTLHISRLTDDYPRPGWRLRAGLPRPLHGGPRPLQARGPLLPDRLRLHGVGPERGPLGGGGLDLGPLDRAREPGRRPRGRADLRVAEHVRPAGARPPGGVRLHGGQVAPEERHRRALRLAAGPLPQRPGRAPVAATSGTSAPSTGAPWRRLRQVGRTTRAPGR